MIFVIIGVITLCSLALGLYYKSSKKKRESALPKTVPIQEIRKR